MSTHTPGPWRIDKPIRGYQFSILAASPLYATANVGIADVPEGVREGEQEANARLIAAAPELLAACRRLDDASIIASAAIAKAEGR